MSKKIIKEVLLTKLRPHSEQDVLYAATSEVELKELAADIEANGLLNEVEITPDYVIICGHRRLEAHRRLRRKTVRCWIRYDLAEKGDVRWCRFSGRAFSEVLGEGGVGWGDKGVY